MKLTFGEFKGKTMEWVFFNRPWYAAWIYENGVHRIDSCFDEKEAEYFLELYSRASLLGGVCPHCKGRYITRMGLTGICRTGMLGNVDFYCNKCEYLGGGPTDYVTPSFFTFMSWMPRCEQKMITRAIHERYIGLECRLTKRVMQEFFRDDENFVLCRPQFFDFPGTPQ